VIAHEMQNVIDKDYLNADKHLLDDLKLSKHAKQILRENDASLVEIES
jgi:hypothetical protein